MINCVLEKIFVRQSGPEGKAADDLESKVDTEAANRILASICQFLFKNVERYLSMSKAGDNEESGENVKIFEAGSAEEEPDSKEDYP